MGAPVSLIPVLAELYAGVPTLGGVPRVVVRLLREAGAQPSQSFADVGSGFGGVAIALAEWIRRDAGAGRVLGVDAFAPFVEAAVLEAQARGVGDICTFRVGDAWALSGRSQEKFDAGVVLNLWNYHEAILLMQACVRVGGVYVLDDAVCVRKSDHFYPGVPTRGESRKIIEASGDRLEAEWMPRVEQIRRRNAEVLRGLRRNAAGIIRRRPGLTTALRGYIDGLQESGASLCGPLRPHMWLVRRRG